MLANLPTAAAAAPDRDREEAALRAVDRTIGALRRGETVVLDRGDQGVLLILALEVASPEALSRLPRLAGGPATLVVSRWRAAGLLGLAIEGAGLVTLVPRTDLAPATVLALFDGHRDGPLPEFDPIGATAAEPAPGELEAIRLIKLARLLPAAAVAPIPLPMLAASGRGGAGARWAADHDLLRVAQADLSGYQDLAARVMKPVAEARVPLAGAENTRLVAFRGGDGGPEHLAIIVGSPDPSQPVLTRLHSECFTGDLMGSLRCDCGQQLQGAIAEIARVGSGLLLYLAQEGRGIGLVNKLRAYRLQDDGFDTIDANAVLGFEADERVYLPAAEMLRQLGFHRVRLMTNNPEKVRQLVRCGIEVAERVAHVFPANRHNDAYLRAKADRAGHLLDRF